VQTKTRSKRPPCETEPANGKREGAFGRKGREKKGSSDFKGPAPGKAGLKPEKGGQKGGSRLFVCQRGGAGQRPVARAAKQKWGPRETVPFVKEHKNPGKRTKKKGWGGQRL